MKIAPAILVTLQKSACQDAVVETWQLEIVRPGVAEVVAGILTASGMDEY
jgi:hypothetical protein